ncbi:MAG: tRNA adenosine(34) deaminase TadA [Gammaproteobacteria bacterium]
MGVTQLIADADQRWMSCALELAQRARLAGEVPVGAVVILGDEVLGEGWNRPIATHDPTAHAEIVALRAASQRRENYRLVGATLYVSLQPCLMCVGAMIHARIARLVFGASDPRNGLSGGVESLLESRRHNHHIQVTGGVLSVESGQMLRAFFKARRLAGYAAQNRG